MQWFYIVRNEYKPYLGLKVISTVMNSSAHNYIIESKSMMKQSMGKDFRVLHGAE